MNNDYPQAGHFESLTSQEHHQRFAELVRQEVAKLAGHDKIAAFDSEMRANGLQVSPQQQSGDAAAVEVDQRAVEFLHQWRRENVNPTSQQRALFERDMAQVLSGRRFGETPTQFTERMRTEAPSPDSAAPSTAQSVPADVQAVTPSGQEFDAPEAVSAVLKAGAAVGVDSATVGAILADAAQITDQGESNFGEAYTETAFNLYDYVIDPTKVGERFTIDKNSRELFAVCRAARQRGIGQAQFERLLHAYFTS